MFHFFPEAESFLIRLFTPERFQEKEPAEDHQIQDQGNQKVAPVNGLALKHICRIIPCKHRDQIIVHIVDSHRYPDVPGLHIDIRQEDSHKDAGNDLGQQIDQPHIRCSVIKEVQRQVPQSPDHTQEQNPFKLYPIEWTR